MDPGYAIVKGIVQGLTEFLPVSSSAHLVFVKTLSDITGWNANAGSPFAEEFFDIMLHIGTLAALLVYFRSDFIHVFKQLTFKTQEILATPEAVIDGADPWDYKRLPWLLVTSTAVTVVSVLVMEKLSEFVISGLGLRSDTVETLPEFYHQHPQFVALHLMITGAILFFVEWRSKKQGNQSTCQPLTFKKAAIIGFCQSIAAIFRGISRSGSTISGGMICGLDRLSAARYSFLLSVLTFTAAAAYEGLKLYKKGAAEALDWPNIVLGTLVSAVVAYFCVHYFIRFVAKQSLHIFSYYCWGMALLMLFLISQNPSAGLLTGAP